MESGENCCRGVSEISVTRWTVLNVDGRDAAQDFGLDGTDPNPSVHPPVNYHAYAACTGGRFEKAVSAIRPGTKCVLILLRKRNLIAARSAIRTLSAQGVSTWVSLKESGSLQASELLSDPRRWADFSEVCQAANGCLSSTPDLVSLYHAAGAKSVEFVPTPYPIDLEPWNFAVPLDQRSGIFLGTREFDVLSRCHTTALAVAARVAIERNCRLVVLNPDGRRGAKMLDAIRASSGIGDAMEVIEGRLPYPDYLRIMAGCRVVWQLDRSRVPGQVAGDALLCRMPCVGGDGAVDRLGHPQTHGDGRDTKELTDLLQTLLTDDSEYQKTTAISQEAAQKSLSFKTVATKLDSLQG